MISRRRFDFDLIVIGSGAGGGVGASYAASLGKKVALFEREAIGGECPNWACVPTKALLYAAETYETVKASGQYGIQPTGVRVDYQKVHDWKNLVVSRTGAAQGEKVFSDEGIKVFKGEAKLTSPHEVVCDGKTYSAAHFLIATGTTVAIPPVPGLTAGNYITFREAVDLSKPPKSILILGGGPIGCEFAQIFSNFGSKVHLAEFLPRLLAREEPEIGDLMGALFSDRGMDVLTNCVVTGVRATGRKKAVYFELNGHEHRLLVDEILVATGKKPVTDIGLEAAGVEYGKAGIKTNHRLQTSAEHIYAAGDVVGPFQFTHTAAYQSHIAAHNAFHRRKLRADYHNIPRCVFTLPEVASVGLTTEMAQQKGIRTKVGTALIAILGRANTSNENNGFVKVVCDHNQVILGAAIVAPRAGELIHELALAIKLRATAREVAEMIHAYPTYSEAIKIACSSVA